MDIHKHTQLAIQISMLCTLYHIKHLQQCLNIAIIRIVHIRCAIISTLCSTRSNITLLTYRCIVQQFMLDHTSLVIAGTYAAYSLNRCQEPIAKWVIHVDILKSKISGNESEGSRFMFPGTDCIERKCIQIIVLKKGHSTAMVYPTQLCHVGNY